MLALRELVCQKAGLGMPKSGTWYAKKRTLVCQKKLSRCLSCGFRRLMPIPVDCRLKAISVMIDLELSNDTNRHQALHGGTQLIQRPLRMSNVKTQII
jgi:hypothetical protein